MASRLGTATKTADQSASFGTETDITSLSVTVDVKANRRIRIYFEGAVSDTLADATYYQFRIKESTTVLKEINKGIFGSTRTVYAAGWVEVDNPSQGSHTYKISLQTNASPSGTVVFRASSTNPAYIWVEDIGPH